MDFIPIHDFNCSLEEMIDIQNKLRQGLLIKPLNFQPKYISGVDLSYYNNSAIAVIITVDYPTLSIKEMVYATDKVGINYRAGFLAFRELPAFLKAWSNLTLEPDLVFFDGYGIVHPRRMGLATHASFFIRKPTVGIAKSKFIGIYTSPMNKRGSYTYITDNKEILGVSLKTKINNNPIYVSIGNFITLNEAITYTLGLTSDSQKIPLVIDLADYYGRKLIYNMKIINE